MGYKTEWYDDTKSIILVEVEGNLSLDEINDNDFKLKEMIQSVTNTVSVIVDANNLQDFPTDLADLKTSNENYMSLPNMGLFVLIDVDHPMVRFLGAAISQMNDVEFAQVSTVSAGVNYIHAFMNQYGNSIA